MSIAWHSDGDTHIGAPGWLDRAQQRGGERHGEVETSRPYAYQCTDWKTYGLEVSGARHSAKAQGSPQRARAARHPSLLSKRASTHVGPGALGARARRPDALCREASCDQRSSSPPPLSRETSTGPRSGSPQALLREISTGPRSFSPPPIPRSTSTRPPSSSRHHSLAMTDKLDRRESLDVSRKSRRHLATDCFAF